MEIIIEYIWKKSLFALPTVVWKKFVGYIYIFSGVKFRQDVVYQKLYKSVVFLPNIQKIKRGSGRFGTHSGEKLEEYR